MKYDLTYVDIHFICYPCMDVDLYIDNHEIDHISDQNVNNLVLVVMDYKAYVDYMDFNYKMIILILMYPSYLVLNLDPN